MSYRYSGSRDLGLGIRTGGSYLYNSTGRHYGLPSPDDPVQNDTVGDSSEYSSSSGRGESQSSYYGSSLGGSYYSSYYGNSAGSPQKSPSGGYTTSGYSSYSSPERSSGSYYRDQPQGEDVEVKHSDCDYGTYVEEILGEHVPIDNDIMEISAGVGDLGPKLRSLGYDQQIDCLDISKSHSPAVQSDVYENIFHGKYSQGERLDLQSERQYGCVIMNATNDVIIGMIDQLVEDQIAPGGYGVLVGSCTIDRSRATDILQYITKQRMSNVRILYWKRTRLPEKNNRTLEVTRIVLKKRCD